MSYHVDPKTLLFDSLTPGEAEALEKEVRDLVLQGKSVSSTRGFLEWCEASGYDERQALLVMATAYPQRALLSLLWMLGCSPRP